MTTPRVSPERRIVTAAEIECVIAQKAVPGADAVYVPDFILAAFENLRDSRAEVERLTARCERGKKALEKLVEVVEMKYPLVCAEVREWRMKRRPEKPLGDVAESYIDAQRVLAELEG